MLSYIWVIAEPPTTLFSMVAMSCEETPSWRARFWSTSMRSTLPGSFQS